MVGCVVGSRPKSGSFSSSGRSESSAGGAGGASSGNETEEGELKARHLLVTNHGSNGQRVLVKIRPPQLPARQHREASCSTDGRQSSDDDDDDDDDDEEEEGDSNSSALSGDMDASPAGRSIEGIPRPISGATNLKMRIVAPDRRRVISRPCVPRGNMQARLVRSEADLFSGHMHLPQLISKSAKYGKLAHQRQQLAADEDEAGQMSDSEDSVMQQIKMKVVHRAAEHPGMCAHPGDEEDDDDDDDDDNDGDEEDEESSEYASSPDSASNAPVIDQSASVKSCRRRQGENLNSDEEGTPRRKRSKSDADGRKMQSVDGAEMAKDVASKDADSVNKMLGAEISVMNEAGEPTVAEQEQAHSVAGLQDNIPASQVTSVYLEFYNASVLLLMSVLVC